MASGRVVPGLYKTAHHKLQIGLWPWTTGLRSRFPQHYKKNFTEQYTKDPEPVHWRPNPEKYTIDRYGNQTRVVNAPIPLVHVPEADLGLWGGESFIFGYRKKKNKPRKPSNPFLWKPLLFKKSLYSEILDSWMQITITQRTLQLIDKCFGFDNYILQTHTVDLRSKLGMRLKREMLITLVTKSMYQDNPDKQNTIFKNYQHFIIPLEEAEWLGLSITQAEKKQARLEAGETEAAVRPLKEVYTEDLVYNHLENDGDKEEAGSLRSRISSWNPFK